MKPLHRLALWIAIAAIMSAGGCGGTGEAEGTRARAHTREAGADTAIALARCAAHGADAALCYFCDPSLRDPARLWCGEHNRYEDRCFLCHPELRDESRLYCEEHGLYEDECFICHPDLFASRASTPARDAGANVAATTAGLYCDEHDLVEAECGICHPELAEQLEPGGSLKVRFASEGSAGRAGVATTFPTREAAERTVDAVGTLGYNLNRLARVTPLVDGVVRAVHADLGDEVTAGQALVTVASPGVAAAKAEFLAALAEETAAAQTLERETALFEQNVSPERDLIDARARLSTVAARRAEAEQNLRDLGFTAGDVEAIARGERPGSSVVLRATFAGTVVARDAVAGDVVAVGTELLRVADLADLWLTIAVPERDVAGVAPGQPVDVRSEATGLVTHGTVTWVSSHLNEKTRMAEIRAVVPNPDRSWKAGTFVDARIHTGGGGDGLAVPAGAVHRFGGLPFVFVDAGGGLYEVRRVDLAGRAGDRAVVADGLRPGERVVTSQSFLVKSEFQKSRLGAGCVD